MSKFLVLFSNFLFCFFSFNANSATYSRGGAELLNAKAYSVLLDTSLFKTTAHYDSKGSEYALTSGGSYRLIDMDFKISYGITSSLEASLFGKFRNVNSSDSNTSATNSGVESIGGEAKYSFDRINNLRYAIGVRYRQTLYTNTRYTSSQSLPTDKVILGDDGKEYGVDFYMTYTTRPWKLDSMIGINYPPNDLSSEIVYKAEAKYQWSKLGLFAGVDGIYSLKRDQYTDTPLSKPLMTEGQSALFNSLNREKVAPYLGIDYDFNKFLMTLKGSSVVYGKSTDKGNLVALGITWSSQGVTADSLKIESFKEYHIEASVLKVSARGNFIKIDQGLSTDVEKGMKFDIYQTDYFGGNELVGTGIVFDIGSDWSVIKLVKKYKEIEIKPGFAARGY